MPLVAIIAGVAIAAGAGYWFGARQVPSAAGVQSGPIAAAPVPAAAEPAQPKVLYWHDPMVPDQKFDKPGKSPFMDMDLVPVYADAAADEGKVSISPRLVQNFGIRTAEVREGTLDTGFSAVGASASMSARSSPCRRAAPATSKSSTCARSTTASRRARRSSICTCPSGSPQRKNCWR